MAKIKIANDSTCWQRCGEGGNIYSLLMEVEIDTVTMEISVVVLQKAGNRSTTRSRHPTPGNLLMHAH